jgi:hypothetical protein
MCGSDAPSIPPPPPPQAAPAPVRTGTEDAPELSIGNSALKMKVKKKRAGKKAFKQETPFSGINTPAKSGNALTIPK